VPRREARASILVLEDEEPVRAMLVQALTEAGHEVHAAPDGPAGLAMIEHGSSFDVVLADLALPGRSGLAVARSVKRASPRTRVVLITGWGHLLDPERLREHGVDLMLVKPFRPERAIAVVSEALRLHPSA
jgi:two-component system response regulator AtoC